MLPPHIASELVRSLEEGVADGENEVVVLIDNRNKPIGVVVTINEFNLTEKLYEIVDNPNQVVRSIFGGGERSKGLTFEQVFGQR